MELNTGKEVLREPLVSPGQQWALWASRPPTQAQVASRSSVHTETRRRLQAGILVRLAS